MSTQSIVEKTHFLVTEIHRKALRQELVPNKHGWHDQVLAEETIVTLHTTIGEEFLDGTLTLTLRGGEHNPYIQHFAEALGSKLIEVSLAIYTPEYLPPEEDGWVRSAARGMKGLPVEKQEVAPYQGPMDHA